ncbi:MAG: phenylalanine--tRNA ligase beta subunit-related protein [Thermovirgaceae bacterium]
MMISVSDDWMETCPDVRVGIIALEGVQNTKGNTHLDRKRRLLEESLRGRYLGKNRKEIAKAPPFAEYQGYFRKFGHNYPVLLQLETVALKGRPLWSPSPLVSAMFMAELEWGFLTAGHYLDAISQPIHLDIAKGDEKYVTMGGKERVLKKGDMFLSDQAGILSSVLYGPDNMSMITPETSRALFTVYGPSMTEATAIRHYLEEIEKTVRVFSPDARKADLSILP